jgi:hypothetical protein
MTQCWNLHKAGSQVRPWRERFEALLARVDRRLPRDIPAEQVEADAAAAVAWAREQIRASGR